MTSMSPRAHSRWPRTGTVAVPPDSSPNAARMASTAARAVSARQTSDAERMRISKATVPAALVEAACNRPPVIVRPLR